MITTLTDRFVAGSQLDGQRQNIFDTKTRGLVLRVGTRTKTWFFSYHHDGATRWLKLGEYPAVGLKDARELALEQRRLLGKQLDPVTERQKALEPPPVTPPAYTFADFVPTYVNFQKGRTKYWNDEHGKIKRYLLPAWGTLPLKDIRRSHVVELLDKLEQKGLAAGLNRIQAVVSRMFTVALNRTLIDSHPATRLIKRVKEVPRDRVLTDDELRTLWTALDAQPGPASDAVRLRLLLGQRGAETAGMRWNEVDIDAALWSMPGARTKNNRPHTVALPVAALEVLKRRRELVPDTEPRVFPKLTLQSDDHRELATIHNGSYEWTDLRRTVGTRLAGLGFDETTIGRVLNHARYTVTAKHYNQHQYVGEIKQALDAWDRELRRILANEPKTRKVVSIRRRS